MIFYAVVSGEIHQVIEFYRTPAEAEAMVESVLKHEPDWEDVLWVEPVELVTGGRNETRRRHSAARAEGLSVCPGRRFAWNIPSHWPSKQI